MIEVTGFWKRFGRFDAVQGLTLTVPAGSAFALIGASGAGKTTTIKTLMNFIQPDRGSVIVMGVDSDQLSPADYSRIGYVSENQELPERMTVGQFVAYLRPFYPSWDQLLENTILKQAQLPISRRIHDLSHGMRAKLALMCALSFRPKLLVCDEPFSGLDPLARDEIMEILLEHRRETTLLISSHELGEIEGVATHVGFMDRGRLLFQEGMADLAARVREVNVSIECQVALPRQLPPEWLNVKVTDNAVSFIETRFDKGTLEWKVAAALGPVGRIDVRPVGLRSIFTTIARSLRNEVVS